MEHVDCVGEEVPELNGTGLHSIQKAKDFQEHKTYVSATQSVSQPFRLIKGDQLDCRIGLI